MSPTLPHEPFERRLVKLEEKLSERITEIERKLDRVIEVETGALIAYSNDPTELDAAQGRLEDDLPRIPEPKMLHTWKLDESSDTHEGELICSRCGVLLSSCGASNESWYCA